MLYNTYYLKKKGEYKMLRKTNQLITISGLLLAIAPVLSNGVSLVLIGEPKIPKKLKKLK